MEDVALVIIDVQGKFLDKIEDRDRLLKRCGFAIEASKCLGIKVIYTEQYPEKLGRVHEDLKKLGLDESRGFRKRGFSAFRAEGFMDYLEEEGIEHLLIGGVETAICVYQTIIDGLKAGYKMTMLSDCVSGRRKEDSVAVVAELQKGESYRLPAETVFYSILGTADDPRYKEFNEIVKKSGV